MGRYSAFFLLVLILVGFGYVLSKAIEDSPSGEAEVEMSDVIAYDEIYTVSRVIDGDTIEVLRDGKPTRVRYIGIDAPERNPDGKPECVSAEATGKNASLVEGKAVRLVRDVRETDDYGRLLRYAYVDDTFVNGTLVQEGYAEAVVFPPDTQFREQFATFEKEAQENQRGMWGVACM